ncbi:MAG: ATP-grasp domain-containing protein [Deltaproteobacteria bacterium]|nr:ATP-grasp domain-containing protein [Deltaproteobacteria bacterium]
MSVIVTNAKNRIAYNIVRSLGQKGLKVYTSDFVPNSMSFASRYSKGNFLYPSPFRNQKRFIKCLIQNIRRLEPSVLIPVFEETFLIAKFKDELSKHVKMVIPDYGQILTAHNKDKWGPIARKLDIPVPKTYAIEDLRNEKTSLKELHYPVLIKPKQGGGGWAIAQENSSKELENRLKDETYLGLPWSRFFIQEKIDGETHCVAMLFRQGEFRAKVTYKQLRDYPVTCGQATLRVSLRNKQAENFFQELLEQLKWHGVCQADFVIDRKTNISHLIDINPRFWGSLAQAIASGVDFPYLLYKIAIDGDVAPVPDFKTGIMTRWVAGDMMTFLPLLRTSNNKMKFVKEFLSLSKSTAFYDDISFSDPLPFFVWVTDAFIRILKNRSTRPVSHDSLEGIWK